MERIAILDHATHKLLIEDIPDEVLDAPEWDGEESYINANYKFDDGYSWDYIVGIEYYPVGQSTPVDVDLSEC